MTQWDYGRSLPPELWHLIENCDADGQSQSPVDIHKSAVVANTKLGPIVPKYNSISLESFFFTHLHLEVEVDSDAGGVEIQGKCFPLKQFHVHTPAEHVVNGRLAKMEIHLVHSDGTKNYVLGVFVEQDNADHPLVQTLVDRLPHLLHKPETLKRFSDRTPQINPEEAFRKSQSYFSYHGSLTTPPCTENTLFFLFASPIYASASQIKAFEKYVPGGNNRPVQPLNGRVIEYYEAN